MKWLAFACVAAAFAVASAPPVAAEAMSNHPWPEAAVRTASLGRTYAVADVAWLKTVQVMGSGDVAQRGYPFLDDWVDLVTSLDPRLDVAYYFGAILLVADEQRAAHVDALLARGEAALPDAFQLSMARGFVAYFGRQDPAAASDHYARAATRPGAPSWIADYAKRLAGQALSCATMDHDLAILAKASSQDAAAAIARERWPIVLSCTSSEIARVDTAYKGNHDGRGLTVQGYQAAGKLPAKLPADPGTHWTLDSGKPALIGDP